MNKRTLLLCASFGTLVLSAAHMPATMDPQRSPSAPSPSATCTQATAQSQDATFDRLTAAYAPGSSASTTSPSMKDVSTETASAVPVAPPVDLDEPTLWLARAIYSETKLPHEQELVAWVVRNRVETRYRGERTYQEVVLDPYQFSAFNPDSPKRSFLMRLGPETPLPRWQQALWVAHYVRHAAPVYRPFSIETRHFYSERSMKERAVPYWAEGSQFVPPNRRRYSVDERRFRFLKQIS